MEIGDHQPAMWVKLMSGFVKLEYEHRVKTKRAVSKSRIMHRTHETLLFPFQNIKETNTRGTLSSPTAMRKRIFFSLCLVASLSTPEQINTSGYITTIHHILKNMLDRYIHAYGRLSRMLYPGERTGLYNRFERGDYHLSIAILIIRSSVFHI